MEKIGLVNEKILGQKKLAWKIELENGWEKLF